MENNSSKQEKNLAKDLKKEDKIKKAIELALLNNKSKVSLEDGKSVIDLQLMKIEADTDETSAEKFSVWIDEDTKMADVSRSKKGIKFDYYNSELAKKIPSNFDINKARIVIEEKQREDIRIKKGIEKGNDIENISSDKTKQQEAMAYQIERGLATGRVTEMEVNREFSESENMRMFVQRAWGISSQRIFRVPGKNTHDFKYVAKTTSGKYKEIPLSTRSEGRNSSQSIFVMDNGILKEKKVDSLLLRGNYGIATDLPESAASQNTKTYLVSRTPSGQYIAIAAGQKSGVNRNTSGDVLQKRMMARGRSVYELEDIIEAAKMAEQIYALNKDGKLTTKEVEMVKKFKVDRNMNDQEVFDSVTLVAELKDMGYECNEIKTILSARNKDEIMKLAKEVEDHSKDTSGKTKQMTELDKDIKNTNGKTLHDGHGEERLFPGERRY